MLDFPAQRTMNKKRSFVIGAIAVLGAGLSYYLASPFLAVNGLRNAVLSKNAEDANKYVDYPALRENLKAELTAHAMKEMQQDPEMADNPFSGLAMAVVGPMVSAMVDGFITPSGMKTIMQLASDPSSASDDTSRGIAERIAGANQTLKDTSMGYEGLDKFRVSYKNEDGTQGRFVFSRTGFADWKLTNIDLNES